MAHTREYLEAVHAAAQRLLPRWMMDALHRHALPSSGGTARNRLRLDLLSNGGTIPDEEVPPEGEPDVSGAPDDPPTAAVTPAVKDGPTSGQSHVDGVIGVIDPRYQPGMPGPGGAPRVRKALQIDLGAEEVGGVEVIVKRAYDAPGQDGIRVLVDRDWPRAVSKSWGRFAMHLPSLAPSAGLGEWRQANPQDWEGFERRYRAELAREPARTAVEKLADLAGRTHVTLVTAAADREQCAAAVLRDLIGAPVGKAVWTAAYIDTFPDSSFAYIAPGGHKDAEGKTVPRTLRHLPYQDKDGDDDEAHIKNALARLPQTDIPDDAKAVARRKIEAAAQRVGVDVAKAEWSAAYIDSLPDASFAWIQPGGKKDDTGRTTPRSLRHLPYKDENGKVDLPHVRDALSRIGQVHGMPAEAKNGMRQHFEALLARTGVGKSEVVSFVKADAQRQVVYGVVLQPDTEDTQDDTITEDEIEKSAHRFLRDKRHVGLQHNGVTHRAAVVESFCAPQDLTYPGIDGTPQTVKKGSWVMAIHVPDKDLWADVQAGKYTGFSPGGWGEREPA